MPETELLTSISLTNVNEGKNHMEGKDKEERKENRNRAEAQGKDIRSLVFK